MQHPVAWIQRGSDRWYAFAAAVANPILIGALARFIGGKPIGERRILLGAVAYALPYVAMWTLKRGGHEMFSMPRVATFRSFVLSHLIHHRGQLSIYLRLNDVPVPAIYGPSADEG